MAISNRTRQLSVCVAIQEEYQPTSSSHTYPHREMSLTTSCRILRVGTEDPEETLTEVVPDATYRNTFLKLTRNLTPDGKTCNRLDIHSPGDSRPITLDLEVRRNLRRVIREAKQGHGTTPLAHEPLRGVLRAIHLDRDWLELADEGGALVRVYAVGEEVDDVIGPWSTRPS